MTARPLYLFATGLLLVGACTVRDGLLTSYTGDSGDSGPIGTDGVSSAPSSGGGGESTSGSTSGSEPSGSASTNPLGGSASEVDTDTGNSSPPFDTFNPNPDIGDGTLFEEELLLIADTPKGRLNLWWVPSRGGDTFQGPIGAAAFTQGSWQSAGPGMLMHQHGLPVINNYAPMYAEMIELAAGTHPFGAGAVTVDIDLGVYFYADQLLCGLIDVDVPGDQKYVDLVFVSKRISDFGADPAPPMTCE